MHIAGKLCVCLVDPFSLYTVILKSPFHFIAFTIERLTLFELAQRLMKDILKPSQKKRMSKAQEVAGLTRDFDYCSRRHY